MTTRTLALSWRDVVGRVSRQTEYGADHRWLELEVPGSFTRPSPGQFVQLVLGPQATGALLPRPMSVAGARMRGGRWVLSFLYAPIGTGTRSLARLRANDEVLVLGPLGRGFPLAIPGTPVLIAGGRGVAPLLFAADELARGAAAARRSGAAAARRAAAAPRRCEFLFGARSKSHLVGLEEARERLARIGGRLSLCTDDGSRGARGNVVELLDRLSPRFVKPIVLHACGPHAMLKAVADWAIANEAPAYLAMEAVMACGTGVCRGCPLPRSGSGRARFSGETPSLFGSADYAMCCTEGPVFEARELDWEHIS